MFEAVVEVLQEAGTVMVWLGSASHVTDPLLPTLMNLYSTTVPGASFTETAHSGFEEVYELALSATASSVSQLPRASMSPTILIVSPYVVATSSSNVTKTDVAVAQDDDVLGVRVVVVAVLVVVTLAVVVV